MKKKKLSHVDKSGLPSMVDVSGKKITERIARARAKVRLTEEILKEINGDELITKKGPVFQTAILAGVAAAKKTHELIPLCHPLMTEDCQVRISINKKKVIIDTMVKVTAKTGAEMEALTISHNITIEEIQLMAKTGGKKAFHRG